LDEHTFRIAARAAEFPAWAYLVISRRTLICACLACITVAVSVTEPSAAPRNMKWAAVVVKVSQDIAVAKVREDTGGRVLDVQTAIQDGVTVYLVKVLLADGRVRVFTVRSE
jgi:hypothetical protein